MRNRQSLGVALVVGLLVQPAEAQTYRPDKDYAFPKTKTHFHLVGDDKPLQVKELDGMPGAVGYPTPTPAPTHPIEVAESARAYLDGRLTDAAAAVEAVAALEPADPSVLYWYARALYRGEQTRPASYQVYQRLISLLDHYGREDAQSTAVYLLYLEAYFKLATLQLDNEQWATASYNLSRTALALGSLPDTAVENQLFREQILQYQTECFAHLQQPELCRYFGQRTLRLFPRNQYVRPYLAKLPKAASKVGRR